MFFSDTLHLPEEVKYITAGNNRKCDFEDTVYR